MTSRLTSTLLTAAILLASRSVWAQGSDLVGSGGFSPQQLRVKANVTHQNGVKLTEETVLHLGVGAEGGYDSNVFYTKEAQTASPLLRITPFLEATNATRGGAIPSGMFFDVTTYIQYREYLTSDRDTKSQRAFNPTFNGIFDFGNGQKFGVILGDQFVRTEEPPYGKSSGNITRNNNSASLQLRAAPGGGRLQAVVRYTNTIDLFENDELKFANMMGHDVMFDGSWKWLPKTALFVQINQGAVTYFHEDMANPKQKSFPFRSVVGLRGLVTEKLSVNLTAGYMAGFYQGGAANPTGLSNLATSAEVTYRPTQFMDFVAGYRHEFRNSVIGTYYDLDSPYLGARQKIGNRFSLFTTVRYENRKYHGYQIAASGMPGMQLDRKDGFLQVFAEADYLVQEWFYAGVSYLMQKNDTNVDAVALGPGGGFDYLKHQLLARVGVTY